MNEKLDPSPGTFADLETEMEDDSLQKQNSLELALNLASPMSPILTLEQLRKSDRSLIFSPNNWLQVYFNYFSTRIPIGAWKSCRNKLQHGK